MNARTRQGRGEHLKLVGRRRRERRIEFDNVVPLRVEVNFRYVFSEKRHEVVHGQGVRRGAKKGADERTYFGVGVV